MKAHILKADISSRIISSFGLTAYDICLWYLCHLLHAFEQHPIQTPRPKAFVWLKLSFSFKRITVKSFFFSGCLLSGQAGSRAAMSVHCLSIHLLPFTQSNGQCLGPNTTEMDKKKKTRSCQVTVHSLVLMSRQVKVQEYSAVHVSVERLARRPVVDHAQLCSGYGQLVHAGRAQVRWKGDGPTVILYILKFTLLRWFHVDNWVFIDMFL